MLLFMEISAFFVQLFNNREFSGFLLKKHLNLTSKLVLPWNLLQNVFSFVHSVPNIDGHITCVFPHQDFMMQQTMLRVKDPAPSLDFYTRVLGMTWVGPIRALRVLPVGSNLHAPLWLPGCCRRSTFLPCASATTSWDTRTNRRSRRTSPSGRPGPSPAEEPWSSRSTTVPTSTPQTALQFLIISKYPRSVFTDRWNTSGSADSAFHF